MRRRLLLVAAVVAVVGTLVACTGSDDASSDPAPSITTTTVVAGCDAAEVPAPGTTDRTMTSGGTERRFTVQVPEGYDGTTPIPVVLALHALTVDNHFVPSMYGLDSLSGAVVVAPSGLLEGTTPYWVAARTEPPSRDVTFIADLLDLLESELCVDPGRVYSTGMSNGAQMSSLLACQLDDRIAAVAPLAGVEWPSSCDGGPVPVLAFHGDADPFVGYEGGGLDAATIADTHAWHGDVPADVPDHEGVEAAMAAWAEHNGCEAEPEVEQVSDEVVRTTWQGCDAETVLYRIVGGGHTWPGRPQPGFEDSFGPTTMDIDATALILDFFDLDAEPGG